MAPKPAPSAGMKVTRGGDAPISEEQAGLVPESSLAAESTRAGGGFAANPGQHAHTQQELKEQRQQRAQHAKEEQQHAQQQAKEQHERQDQEHRHKSKPARQQGYVLGTGQSKSQAGAPHVAGGGGGGGGAGTAADKTTSLDLENQQTERGGYRQGHDDQPGEQQGAPAPSYAHGSHYEGGDVRGKPHGKNLHEGGFEGSGTAEGPLAEPGSADDPSRLAERALMGGMRSHGGPREVGIRDDRRYDALGSDEPA